MYGFAQSQVKNRAPKLCQECTLQYNCPIQTWPDETIYQPITQKLDFEIAEKFGPTNIIDSGEQPEVVWLTGESLGDDDPALKNNSELPVVFVFDELLLSKLKLSSKRINFLLDTLREISHKKDLSVFIKHLLKIGFSFKIISCLKKISK